MSIYPMNRWRLYNNFDTMVKKRKARLKYVNLFSLIAWIILIIACINFMNLATARSEQRAREVGVRKVLGAGKRKLIASLLANPYSCHCFQHCLLLLLFICYCLHLIHLLKKIALDIFNPFHIVGLLVITLLCGLIAGSYPHFIFHHLILYLF